MNLLDGYTGQTLLGELPHTANRRHLDIACGEFGIWSHFLSELRDVDDTEYSVKLDLHVPRSPMTEPLVRANSCALPFGDSQFDVVTIGYLLDLLNAEEQSKTLQEANRVLQMGGHAVGDVLLHRNHPDGTDRVVPMANRLKRLYLQYIDRSAASEKEEFQALFTLAGFQLLVSGFSYDRDVVPQNVNFAFVAQKIREV